jgi:maltooligosyltrehalose trehalohydrolase
MQIFKVWAPRPRELSVKVGEEIQPLTLGKRGWWSTQVANAGPGTDYWFKIDGSELPDPRSPWQPEGIHGPSRIVDHRAFAWTDQHWQARPLSSAIVYELHIGTFTKEGTFQSAIERLDYLVELGITHVEIMPVNEFSGNWGWGYDSVDLYAPHHAYGTPEDLKTLVNECHRRGLAVLLDVVYNHFGPVGNYLSRFGPYLTTAYNTPWGEAVNFDHRGSLEVRRFFIDNALMWLRDYHFDGLRLDAIHAYFDRSAIHFLESLSFEVNALEAQIGRQLVLIAESDLNDPRVVTSREAGGFGIDAQWSDDFHHALHAILTGETNGYYLDFGLLDHLAKSLTEVFVYNGNYSEFRGRTHGRPVHGSSAHRFLGYSQNHDQIGNRARGERLCHLVNPGRAKIAAAIVLTAPFVPMLFQGEEFAASTPFLYFTQHEEEQLSKQVSEGRRSEFEDFGWKPEEVPDPQAPETFHASKLDWRDLDKDSHRDMLAWYRELIALRKSRPELSNGRLEQIKVRCDNRCQWFAFRRRDVEVVCNLAADRQAVPVTLTSNDVLASENGWSFRPGLIELPGDSVAIILD